MVNKGLRVKEIAKERAMTLRNIAEQLGIHYSNMSAIASGARGISLGMLKNISHILDCDIDELLVLEKQTTLFKNKQLKFLLDTIEKQNHDGLNKTWLHKLIYAQKMHYQRAKQ